MGRRRILEAVKDFRRLKGHKDMPKLLAGLRARDQQLGIAVSVENVAQNITEPPRNFNSARDNPPALLANVMSEAGPPPTALGIHRTTSPDRSRLSYHAEGDLAVRG